jgi:lantibiotic biosynthesis protein
MNLFPDVLVRTSGGPFRKLQQLSLETAVAISGRIHEEKKKRDVLKQQVSDQLYTLINSLEDKKEQNFLLNLRRDIFNNRKVKPDVFNYPFPPAEADNLRAYQSVVEEIERLEKEGEMAFGQELLTVRNFLKELATEENLQKGLVLSSQDLLDGVKDYLSRDLSTVRKKELNTERSLMKYITRMYAKTSPFSTFTNLTIGRASGSTQEFLSTEGGEKGEIVSHIRLNNHLYKFLKDLLLKNREAFRWLQLRPNPTLRNNGDHFLYLTNSNNIEAFQRIPANPILDLFVELISERKEGVVYRELINMLIEGEYIDAAAEELEGYIDQLISYGFLEYNMGVSGIDPDWDLKLVQKLSPLVENNVPHIQELVQVLKKIRELAGVYAGAGIQERKETLREAHSLFRDVCMKLHEAAGLPEDERKPREQLMAEHRQKMKDAEKEKKEKEEKEKAEGAEPKAEAPAEAKEEPAREGENAEGEEQKTEEVFRHQTSTYFAFKPEQMFYEDTTTTLKPVLSEKQLTGFITSLDNLLQHLRMFNGRKDEKDIMSDYFTKKYGKEGPVNLLTFYEDFYREYKKPEAERTQKLQKEAMEKAKLEKEKKENEARAKAETAPAAEAAPAVTPENAAPAEQKQEEKPAPPHVPLPVIAQRQEMQKKWFNKFAENLGDRIKEQSLDISPEDLSRTNADMDITYGEKRSCSYGAFTQFYTEKNAEGETVLKGVLNANFPGYGKMFSRFLHLFDAELTGNLRKWNLSLAGSALYVEDCDASYFNANLHPPLLPYEVWMPGGHNSLPEDKQLAITDFEVRWEEEEQDLCLYHTLTGQRAFIFDLGFQGHMGRSALFQLLEKFSGAEYLSIYPLLNAIQMQEGKKAEEQKPAEGQPQEKKETRAPEVRLSPRIVYDGRIVLKRMEWTVPRDLLPLRQPVESDWSYFCRVNEWRLRHNLPDEVFIYVNSERNNKFVDPEIAKKLGRDDYKPQYINFRNPLLIHLLEKSLVKVPYALKVVEMSPNSSQLLKLNGEQYIIECVVQWYRFAGAPEKQKESVSLNEAVIN